MPRGDGTGPASGWNSLKQMAGFGKGVTSGGRGRAGLCAGGNRNNVRRDGQTAGPGRCGWFNASELAGGSARDAEIRLLMQQSQELARQLDEVNSKLDALKK